MESHRSNIPKVTREEVFKRDRNICDICGKSVTKGTRTIDHFTPVVLGGSDQKSNLRTAHRKCNSQKSDHLPIASDLRPRSYDEPMDPINRVIEAEQGSINNLSRKSRQQEDVGFLNLPKGRLY